MLLPMSARLLQWSPSWKNKNHRAVKYELFSDWTYISVTLSTNTKINPVIQATKQSCNYPVAEPITYSLPQLPLFPLLHGGEVVDRRVLDHREEDEDEADPEIDVYRLDVGDPRHGGVDPRDDGGHGQHGGDACGRTRRESRFLFRCRALDTSRGGNAFKSPLYILLSFSRLSVSLCERAYERHLFERTAHTCCFFFFLFLLFNK